MRSALTILLLLLLNAACGLPARPVLLGARPPDNDQVARAEVVRAAQSLARAPLTVRGVKFDPDPVGYLRAAYWAAGIDLFDHIAATDPSADGLTLIERSARLRGQLHLSTPRPGDLALFRGPGGELVMAAVVTEVRGERTTVRGWFALGPEDARMRIDTAELTVDGTPENDALSTGTTLKGALAGFVDPFR